MPAIRGKPQSLSAYLHTQGIGAAIGNVLVNPLLAWLSNRKMEALTLFGDHSIIFDTTATAVIASLLVTLFVSSGVQRDLKTGRIAISADIPYTKGILAHLPRGAGILGLTIGVAIAAVIVPLTVAVFRLFNITEMPFKGFLVTKAAYTGLLGFVVARCVILRKLVPNQEGVWRDSN